MADNQKGSSKRGNIEEMTTAPTDAQLKFMANKMVRKWHAIRKECEEEIDLNQSIIRVLDTHKDNISKDPYLLRRFESLKKKGLQKILEYEELLQKVREGEQDILSSAQWARRMLKERKER